jgi:citrate lyase gamma subunit
VAISTSIQQKGKRIRALIDSLTKELLSRLHIERSKVRIVDATGIPLIRLVRKKEEVIPR